MFSACLMFLIALGLTSQQPQAGANPQPPATPASAPAPDGKSEPARPAPADEEPIVTRHEARAGGRTLKYTATTGFLPVRNATSGELEARVFFIAYTLDGSADPAKRPLMISFNGGPGSSSVWLHLGALGPRRVRMNDDGTMPAAPYALVDNEATWLDRRISCSSTPSAPASVARRNPNSGSGSGESKETSSRLGSSSGCISPAMGVGAHRCSWWRELWHHACRRARATSARPGDRLQRRAARLVDPQLPDRPVHHGNDLPYVLYLPTYAATAWYHKRLASDLQRDLGATLREVEAWAGGAYSARARRRARRLPRTNAAPLQSGSRATPGSNDGWWSRTISASRSSGSARTCCAIAARRSDGSIAVSSAPTATMRPSDLRSTRVWPRSGSPYTAMFNDYVRRDLGFSPDLPYDILGGGIGSWEWNAENRFADTSDALGGALTQNPHMRLFVGSGYFDLATPYCRHPSTRSITWASTQGSRSG